ncbi:phage antirepressor KilAC domain-containing protein [Gottschalkiaceae bacterium SANA]|nr:phage antirepressor KilAC domain-containing protein [Gottschalkiaceae bacterium SANA]
MNEMMIFTNKELGEVRTLRIDGEPWFVGKDVAVALGYSDSDQAIRKHVDDEDKLTRQIKGLGQNRNMKLINESGLYSLIMTSKLESAKTFKRWVTKEVLPSIRRHGLYATEDLLENPDLAIQALQRLKKERKQKLQLQKKIELDQVYTDFGRSISKVEDGILIGEYAKLLKSDGIEIGQNKLFAWMRGNGYLIGSGKRKNSPIQKYLERGLFEVTETIIHTRKGDKVILTTLLTGKGQLYFYEKLKTQFGLEVS